MGWEGRYKWKQAIFCLCYIIYLIAGSLLFVVFERPIEQDRFKEAHERKDTFLLTYPNVNEKKERVHRLLFVENTLDELLADVVAASEKGISVFRNTTFESNWSIGQALFFATTVVTTIGYGHITPVTIGGKIFCVIFAILGIPLTFLFFTVISTSIVPFIKKSKEKLSDYTNKVISPLSSSILHLGILFLILFTFIICIPAVILSHIEPTWDFLSAFYYVTISLTTVGLGDYIPGDSTGQPNRTFYKICTTVYLYVGLISMVIVIRAYKDIPQINLARWLYPPKEIKGERKGLLENQDIEGSPKTLGTRASLKKENEIPLD